MTRKNWATFTVFPVPTASHPVHTLNDDLITTTTHDSVKAYLAHRRRQSPHMLFKSVRGDGWVEIRWTLNPHFIRREAHE